MGREGCKDGCVFRHLCQRSFAGVCQSFNVEWGVKESHVTVIALHNCGKSYSQIFKRLKPLTISQMFIFRAIKRCEGLWRVEDRARSGRPKSLRAQAAIKTVRERIRRNPLWKQLHRKRWLWRETRGIKCYYSALTVSSSVILTLP